jgi:hypothetical protein
MIQPFPRPVKPKVRTQTDDQVAKLGQLNQLVRDVNQLQSDPSTPTGIPFEWFPPAGLTNAGAKFTYLPGPNPGPAVELISYHIKGIQQISSSGSGMEVYLCSINFPDGQPFYFPGNLLGSLQITTDNNFVTTPLGDGGLVLVNDTPSPIGDFGFNLFTYQNPQPDDSYSYALVMTASVGDSGNISALMAYDFELLLPNFAQAPTIFQD